MEEKVNALAQIIKFASSLPVLITIVFASGILVMLPDSVINQLQLIPLRKSIGWIVSILFIFSAIWLFIRFLIWLLKVLGNRIDLHNAEKYLKEDASFEELDLLLQLFKQPGFTEQLVVDEPAVKGLMYRHAILKIGSTIQPDYNGFSGSYSTAIRLQDWTIKYVKKNKKEIQSRIMDLLQDWIVSELGNAGIKKLREYFGNELEKQSGFSTDDFRLRKALENHFIISKAETTIDNMMCFGDSFIIQDWAKEYINEKFLVDKSVESE